MMSFDFFWFLRLFFLLFFFFNATATTDIYTLSLHDALPICHIKFNLTIPLQQLNGLETLVIIMVANKYAFLQITRRRFSCRSEERFSRNAETDLVCRLLLEKKNIKGPSIESLASWTDTARSRQAPTIRTLPSV